MEIVTWRFSFPGMGANKYEDLSCYSTHTCDNLYWDSYEKFSLELFERNGIKVNFRIRASIYNAVVLHVKSHGEAVWLYGPHASKKYRAVCQSKCTRRCQPPPLGANLTDSGGQLGPPPATEMDQYVPGDKVE